MSEKRRPASLRRGAAPDREPIPGPDQRTVVLRMVSGAPYVLVVDATTAAELVESLSACWDGDREIGAPRVLDADGRGFMVNPAHVVGVDVR